MSKLQASRLENRDSNSMAETTHIAVVSIPAFSHQASMVGFCMRLLRLHHHFHVICVFPTIDTPIPATLTMLQSLLSNIDYAFLPLVNSQGLPQHAPSVVLINPARSVAVHAILVPRIAFTLFGHATWCFSCRPFRKRSVGDSKGVQPLVLRVLPHLCHDNVTVAAFAKFRVAYLWEPKSVRDRPRAADSVRDSSTPHQVRNSPLKRREYGYSGP
ncbi:hypothetical protein CR513_43127, partial [Mucuna pruriens]